MSDDKIPGETTAGWYNRVRTDSTLADPTTYSTDGEQLHARTLAGQWRIFRPDSEVVANVRLQIAMSCEAGFGDEPDWSQVIDTADWLDEPREFIAERFVLVVNSMFKAHWNVHLREVRVRWFGGDPHEWDDVSPPDEAGSLVRCVNCDLPRSDVGSVSAPWDEKCRGDFYLVEAFGVPAQARLGDPGE